jgi:hypothetical protein
MLWYKSITRLYVVDAEHRDVFHCLHTTARADHGSPTSPNRDVK